MMAHYKKVKVTTDSDGYQMTQVGHNGIRRSDKRLTNRVMRHNNKLNTRVVSQG